MKHFCFLLGLCSLTKYVAAGDALYNEIISGRSLTRYLAEGGDAPSPAAVGAFPQPTRDEIRSKYYQNNTQCSSMEDLTLCGDKTQWDAMDKLCVPVPETVCGYKTQWNQTAKQCVPVPDTLCGDKTQSDAIDKYVAADEVAADELYNEITSGKCGDSGGGWSTITSNAACGKAAAAVGWSDTTAQTESLFTGALPGCYLNGAGVLWFNTVGTTPNVVHSLSACSSDNKCVCVKKLQNLTAEQAAAAALYNEITSGKCGDSGYTITTVFQCEAAASALGWYPFNWEYWPEATASPRDSSDYPLGCVFNLEWGLRFNIQNTTVACGDKYTCLCATTTPMTAEEAVAAEQAWEEALEAAAAEARGQPNTTEIQIKYDAAGGCGSTVTVCGLKTKWDTEVKLCVTHEPETVCGDGTQWDADKKECVPEINCFIAGFCVEWGPDTNVGMRYKGRADQYIPCQNGIGKQQYNLGATFVYDKVLMNEILTSLICKANDRSIYW